MSTQVWALAGVIVGAVLGGGAQILADRLRHRREQDDWLRNQRQAAYHDVLAACDELLIQIRNVLTAREIRDSDPTMGEHVQLEVTAVDELFDHKRDLIHAVERVRIYGTNDTISEAIQVEVTLQNTLEFISGGGQVPIKPVATLFARVTEHREKLLLLMRAELGISD